MMKRRRPSAVTLWLLGLVTAFLLALALTSASLIRIERQETLANSKSQALRFVSSAEAAINRNLLAMDMMLSSLDEALGLSKVMLDWIDARAANRLLGLITNLNMMVRHVALVDPQGRVIASSATDGAYVKLSLPEGFVDEVTTQIVSTLTISAPVTNTVSSERVLYLARHIKLADSSRVLAVAEIPVAQLASVLAQGADIPGLEVTLERDNGQLLASMPAMDQLSGQRLHPMLGAGSQLSPSGEMSARLSSVPAIVATRPTLYRGLLIAASIPIQSVLQEWRDQRNFIIAITLLFALMILGVGGLSAWYLNRLATARRASAQSKEALDQALASMVSGFMLLDAEQRVVRWNTRFEEMFPWLQGCLRPMIPFRTVLEATVKDHLPHAPELERQHWVEERMRLLLNPHAPHEQTLSNGHIIQITERNTPQGGIVIVYHDVTDIRHASAEIQSLAFYDPLTHLPNRRLLMDRLQRATAASARSGEFGAVLFLDLDRFKTLNDTLGHAIGDLLLQQVAQRLRACVRDNDTVARLGGDEFVVMLEDLSQSSEEAAGMAQRIGEKILERLNQTYQLAQHNYHSTPSIGATLFNTNAQSPDELLKQADIAMYQIKLRGRNALCFFDPEMQAAISARAQLEEDIRGALRKGQFELHYQPQIADGTRIFGAEVLIRWHHPTRGMVPPLEFIEVAEDSELILKIGEWVLRTACQQLAQWQSVPRFAHLHLCVNVSARQFREPDFVDQVDAILQETGIRPQFLQLEITESQVLENVQDTISKMGTLKALGVRFSVDDFGTGHSSLTYLTRLPLDQLKIDQAFVRNIGLQHADAVIVQTIIGMAHSLQLEVIAEGVETKDQQAFLAQHGCTLYQGYLFGKPTPLAEFEALLAPTQAMPTAA